MSMHPQRPEPLAPIERETTVRYEDLSWFGKFLHWYGFDGEESVRGRVRAGSSALTASLIASPVLALAVFPVGLLSGLGVTMSGGFALALLVGFPFLLVLIVACGYAVAFAVKAVAVIALALFALASIIVAFALDVIDLALPSLTRLVAQAAKRLSPGARAARMVKQAGHGVGRGTDAMHNAIMRSSHRR